MKKIISILLIALVAILCLVACDHEITGGSSGSTILEIVSKAATGSIGNYRYYHGTYYIDASKPLENGTGNFYYEIYSDEACTTKISDTICYFAISSNKFTITLNNYSWNDAWTSNEITAVQTTGASSFKFTKEAVASNLRGTGSALGYITSITCYDTSTEFSFIANPSF